MKFEINDIIISINGQYLPKSYNTYRYSPYMGNKCLFVNILTNRSRLENDEL